MSQAADSLTRPGPAGNRGIASAATPARRATASAAVDTATTGFVKNDPALRRLGSSARMTMDFFARSASTAARASASVGAVRACQR